MKSLTNLSLNLWYFFKDNFSQFQTHLRAVFLLLRKGFEFYFVNFYPLLSHLIFYAAETPNFYSDFFKSRNTKVSDEGLATLGLSLKDMKSLTNLSLNVWYCFKDYFSHFQMHLSAVFLAAHERL
jgi:hypothetical protein